MNISKAHKFLDGSGELLRAALCYTCCAFVGAVAGKWYYLPKPPSLSESFVVTDLRYAGAIVGALIGASLAAILARAGFRRLGTPPSNLMGLGIAAFLLELVLLGDSWRVGGLTTVVLLIPWIAVFFSRCRLVRRNARPLESGPLEV